MYQLGRIVRQTFVAASNKRIHTTPAVFTFWERDDKGGYASKEKVPFKEKMRVGLQELKKEIALWQKEVIEHFQDDPVLTNRPGETDVIWQFQEEESLKNLSLTNSGTGLFSGELSTKVPKDGRIKRAGYCNMKTLRARKSFKRETYLDWTCYNMLVLRVRGDGRSYMINIMSRGYFDILWSDMYHYALYTRGGPYWQLTKIPFSKFFLGSKGRVQDNQYPLPTDRITGIGISAADKIGGPFELEIDYIGLEYDPTHSEEFAYEMYKLPKYMAAT